MTNELPISGTSADSLAHGSVETYPSVFPEDPFVSGNEQPPMSPELVDDDEVGDVEVGNEKGGDENVDDEEVGDEEVGDEEVGDEDVGDEEVGDEEVDDEEQSERETTNPIEIGDIQLKRESLKAYRGKKIFGQAGVR